MDDLQQDYRVLISIWPKTNDELNEATTAQHYKFKSEIYTSEDDFYEDINTFVKSKLDELEEELTSTDGTKEGESQDGHED